MRVRHIASSHHASLRTKVTWNMDMTTMDRRGFASKVSGSPLERYKALLAAGEIQQDPRQEVAMGKLDELSRRLSGYVPTARNQAPAAASTGGGFFGFFSGGGQKKPEPQSLKPHGPRGLYLWGGTGTGKTFMMDMFHDAMPIEKKRRIHFHEWMIDVHERLHHKQKARGTKDASADDIIAQVAREMMSEAWLLCFDEFQVTHISDAIIMKRVFSVLFEQGAVIVATSNRPPEDLYLNGLNRTLFLPFIPMLKDFCEVHDIGAEVDYRLISTADGEEDKRVYIHPNGEKEQKMLEKKFYRICQGAVHTGVQVEAQGRRLVVPKAAINSSVGWFTFKDLCDKALGAADYLAVASAFHTVFLADIPKLTLQERDQVRRFITLIDAFYERHVKLVCTADRDPISLFEVSEDDKKNSSFDEIFAWDRTVSRLIEMQSTKYLSEAIRSMSGEQFLGQFKLKSLSDDDIAEMWRRYDSDDSGMLDMEELRFMLQDMLEKRRGHRNLSQQMYDLCIANIDKNADGEISFEEFRRCLGDYSTLLSTMN